MNHIIEEIIQAWSWKISTPKQVLAISGFGNILVKDTSDNIWRICPEELEAEIV